MTPTRNLQSRVQAARERDEALRREREAIVRAETAEQQLRATTQRLDLADRELIFLRGVVELQNARLVELQAKAP